MSTTYGTCATCGITLATAKDAEQHRAETMRPTGRTSGVLSRSHTTRSRPQFTSRRTGQ